MTTTNVDGGPLPDRATQLLIDLAVESWRFAKVFARVVSKLDLSHQGRYESQYRWYLKRLQEHLETAGIRLVNVEGQAFDPGMAATAVNGDAFEPEDRVVVDQMLEPIVMGVDGVLRTGTVLLRRV
jgi:hypothetical protein